MSTIIVYKRRMDFGPPPKAITQFIPKQPEPVKLPQQQKDIKD